MRAIALKVMDYDLSRQRDVGKKVNNSAIDNISAYALELFRS